MAHDPNAGGRTLRKISITIQLALIFIIHLVHCSDSNDCPSAFEDGTLLMRQGQFEQASQKFLQSLFTHNPYCPFTPMDAIKHYIRCFSEQQKTAEGFARLGLIFFEHSDNRGRMFIEQAYSMEPDNILVLQAMKTMGLTSKSIGLFYRTDDADADFIEVGSEDEVYVGTDGDFKFAHSGWNDDAISLYNDTVEKLKFLKKRDVKIHPTDFFKAVDNKFWDKFVGGTSWEKSTFEVFTSFVDHNTIVIDIGSWIGPTLFFHGQFSKRSIGIEADPVAFAELEYNLELNKAVNLWSDTVSINSLALTANNHAGSILRMKTNSAGGSGSGIGRIMGHVNQQWTVKAYSLPFLLDEWGVSLEDKLFLKIDIESYECQLLPSFYEWLKYRSQSQLPTIFVSFHPQIQLCTKSQLQDILKLMALYNHVFCGDGSLSNKLTIDPSTTIDQFQDTLKTANCFTQQENSDFLLSSV